MFRAYVGIADQEGLVSFFQEGAVPCDWLVLRAAACRRLGAVPYRAILTEDNAREVRADLERGQRAEALSLLRTLSLELRPFVASVA